MEENIGMVMGFTVISEALEWLGNRWDTIQREEDERIKRQKELEEEEEKVNDFLQYLDYLGIPELYVLGYHKYQVTV